jgi:hypothetical protein
MLIFDINGTHLTGGSGRRRRVGALAMPSNRG